MSKRIYETKNHETQGLTFNKFDIIVQQMNLPINMQRAVKKQTKCGYMCNDRKTSALDDYKSESI